MNTFFVNDSELRGLVRRADLFPALLRRKIEDVVLIVNPSLQPSDSQ